MTLITREAAKKAKDELFNGLLAKGITLSSASLVKGEDENWEVNLNFANTLTKEQKALVDEMVANQNIKANIEENMGFARQHGR